MAFDEDLATRVRGLVAERTEAGTVAEKRMFGGLAFMVDGHMATCVSGQGGIMVRVDRAATDDLVASTAAEPMIMRGKPMAGWVRVATADVADDVSLTPWVERGLETVRGLPPAT